ncbi:putative DD41D transposase [Trichonephila clavipes]|nr:putative DD41D transposase [Trichonephila clavipes]
MVDRISICEALVKRNEIDLFLKKMVTGDDKWVTHYNIVRKRSWSNCDDSAQMVTKPGLTTRKVLLCIWLVVSFFKNDEGHNVTVNGDRYRAMITNFFIPELNNHDVQELWFQQDGATYHTARATIDLLKDTFGDHLISRLGLVNWPPRSCDLTPLDYFLWGYVKSLVYADNPQTLDHLEDNICRVIADIRPQMLEKVIENWTSRLDYIRASRGSHMPEIIFKINCNLGLGAPPLCPGATLITTSSRRYETILKSEGTNGATYHTIGLRLGSESFQIVQYD